MEDTGLKEAKPTFQGAIRELRQEDLPAIKPILEQWIRNSETKELLTEEIEAVLGFMLESIDGRNGGSYIIAEDVNKEIVGVAGFKSPDETMRKFAQTKNPAELINFFVKERGKGVGLVLDRSIREKAKSKGHTELILNSGPRYKSTAWDFYDRHYDRVGLAKDYYGTGRDAPVWSKRFA